MIGSSPLPALHLPPINTRIGVSDGVGPSRTMTFWDNYALREFVPGETLLIWDAEVTERATTATSIEPQYNCWFHAMVAPCTGNFEGYALSK